MIFLKRMLSFLKSEWTLADYPIRYTHWDIDRLPKDQQANAFPWVVEAINWGYMAAVGNTKADAYANLERRFNEYKASGEKLPRPGVKQKRRIEFAPITEVDSVCTRCNRVFFKNTRP